MLFERLSVQNLGAFRGEHALDLVPVDPRKPIVLVGALNGSGKTTVIEALQLALYGKRAGYGWRGATAYAQYLDQVRNRNAKATDTTVAEVTLRLADGRRLRVRRQWSFLKETPREYVSVFVNDGESPDLGLSEGWDDEVERLLPVRLSELFFFDGERIEKLADPAKSGEVLRTAVASLMGLDIIDHLIADLEILRGRLRQRLLPESEQARYESINSDCRVLRQELEDVRQNKAQLIARLGQKQAALLDIQRRLQSQGGDRFKQRERISEERAQVTARLESTQQRQREIAGGCLPLALVQQSLGRLRLKSEALSVAGGVETAHAVRARLDRLLQWLDGKKYPSQVRKEIREYVATELQEVDSSDRGDSQFNWTELRAQLSAVLDHRLPSAVKLAHDSVADDHTLAEQLLRLEERLLKVPELEQLTEAFREAGAAEEEIRGIEKQIAMLVQQENDCVRRLSGLDRDREALLQLVLKAGDSARAADYCHRSIATLTMFRASLVERRRKQLEQLILKAFQVLARKTDLVDAVSIDPDTMVVRLRTTDGQVLAAQQLSAGERQLLAIAILWGLARASGRPVPVVIDTPLGRLDGEHRKALVERYFPDASHQVILLSTDKEVDADFSRMLDNSVAHRYLIDYSAVKKSSSFSPGYFAG